MMSQKLKNELISRIIELELENTRLIFQGHKPTENDHFQFKREEMNTLRCILFGYNTNFCKKGSQRTLFS